MNCIIIIIIINLLKQNYCIYALLTDTHCTYFYSRNYKNVISHKSSLYSCGSARWPHDGYDTVMTICKVNLHAYIATNNSCTSNISNGFKFIKYPKNFNSNVIKYTSWSHIILCLREFLLVQLQRLTVKLILSVVSSSSLLSLLHFSVLSSTCIHNSIDHKQWHIQIYYVSRA